MMDGCSNSFEENDNLKPKRAFATTKSLLALEIPKEVNLLPTDFVVSVKTGQSACLHTNLELIIADKNIERLFVVGYLTDQPVQHTVECVNNLQKGAKLKICVVHDCCNAETEMKHLDTIASLKLISNTISSKDVTLMLTDKNLVEHGSEIESIEINTPSSTKTSRPRILVLHGAKSNNDVTKLQLQNLNLNENDFDAVYHHGPIKDLEADSSLEGFFHGPFYSWFDTSSDRDLGRSVIAAVVDVLHAMTVNGPFHGIYAFSSGAIVATLIAGIKNDIELLRKVTSLSNNVYIPKLEFVILACAVSSIEYPKLRDLTGLKASLRNSINVPSFHLIGFKDGLKYQSEYVASLYSNCIIRYLQGGHNVGRTEMKDLHDFARSSGSLRRKLIVPRFIPTSEISSIAVLPSHQVALVNFNTQINPNEATIISVLKSHQSDKPFLYSARTLKKSTSYGEVLSFIRGGKGDLRRLGVKAGEVVAYCAPLGASAVLAFVSMLVSLLKYYILC